MGILLDGRNGTALDVWWCWEYFAPEKHPRLGVAEREGVLPCWPWFESANPRCLLRTLQKSLAELHCTATFQASISIRSFIAFPQSGLAVKVRFGKSRNHLLRRYLAAI